MFSGTKRALKKIVSIKNVGRFKNSAAAGNPQLAKHTLLLGANGYGKTTICAVLRSLQGGDPAHVLGRKTLGVSDAPTIELLFPSGQARFDGAAWSTKQPGIAIFDGTFVADNVHSGELIDIAHKRGLYRIIIGDDGVQFANKDAELAIASRNKTTEISGLLRTIQTHVPNGMTLDAFLGLPQQDNIDEHIADQQSAVDVARQAGAIRARPSLIEYAIPSLPEGLAALLSKTIDDVAQDAESQLAAHLSAHGMTDVDGTWIATGVEHADDSCPFCGQDIKGVPLIAAYRAIFSERYKSLSSDITAMEERIYLSTGEAALARLDVDASRNRAEAEFWNRYFTLDADSIMLPKAVLEAIQAMGSAALRLIERKVASPLSAISLDTDFLTAQAAYDAAIGNAQSINTAIRSAKAIIAEKKTAAGTADIRAAESEQQRRRAMKTRHSDAVAAVCVAHAAATRDKTDIDEKKVAIRAELDKHMAQVVKPYERRINDYLEAFNADFSITETKHAYPGGIATSSYQLVINKMAVDLGDGNTPGDRHCFRAESHQNAS